MKLAMSNIGWEAEQDQQMYERLQQMGFSGLEIAPTRIFSEKPYEHLAEAQAFAQNIKDTYQLVIPSMQSIWFGQSDNLFTGEDARAHLLEYTKKAILFAEAAKCSNLVFGCPRNRTMPEGLNQHEQNKLYDVAIAFFDELADYAIAHGTVVSMEANPPIYHTNFINETVQAFEIVKEIQKKGFQINLDLGTMIQNEEDARLLLKDNMVSYINHIHISEPGLAPIQMKKIHQEIKDILLEADYQKFVSIEMGKQTDLNITLKAMEDVTELFQL